MTFVAFHYMYRDYANYKRHNCVIFSNPPNIPLEEIDSRIRAHLIDSEYFLHHAWGVPDLHFEKTDWELDHPLHTYKYVEFITEPEKVEGTIDEFLKRIASAPNTFPI